MEAILEKIIAHEHLTFEEAYEFIHDVDQDKYEPEVISGILVGIQMRGVQLEELKGFRKALLELSTSLPLDGEGAIDLCGTGGDGKNTFNVSTTSSFVLATMGKKVIKHGNYGVSSLCGSSNVLEELGATFSSDFLELEKRLEKNNICFLHAPLFHPTMKKVAPVRKRLSTRTIFNCLGPLVNPVQPTHQLTGTYSLELAKLYQHILRKERTNFVVAYGMDGYDEITLTDNARLLGKTSDAVLGSTELDIRKVGANEITSGKSIQDAARILRGILSGEGTDAQNAVVAANVAVALHLYHPETAVKDLYKEALSTIASGHCIQQLQFN